MKRFFAMAMIVSVLFAFTFITGFAAAYDGQNAQDGFKLAAPFVKLLSNGEYYLRYQMRPNDRRKPEIYAVQDDMTARLSEANLDYRDVSRDGNLYSFSDKEKHADVYLGMGQPPLLPAGEYKFMGAGEKKYFNEPLTYEEALPPDGKTIRFFFKEKSLCGVMLKDHIGFGYLFPVILKTGKSWRKGMFDIPENYKLRDPEADM